MPTIRTTMTVRYGLIFDVDGVIADSESVNVRATARAFSEILEIEDVTPDDFTAGIGRGAEEYVRAGARSHGKELSQKDVRKLVKAREEYFLSLLSVEPLPPFPGVCELIALALENDNVGLAIATSGTRQKSRAVLESAGIPYRKMVYVCGDDITHKKPDPEVFQVACRKLKMEPTHCVVIEDAPDGVAAAHTAGCRCIAVTNSCSRNALKDADLTVATLSAVTLDTIQRLLESRE